MWPTSARVTVSLLVATVAVSAGLNGYLLTKKQQPVSPIFMLPQELIGLAKANFPIEFESGMPEGQDFAFLLDSAKVARSHAKVDVTLNEPLPASLKRAFPLLKMNAQTTSGATCFQAELGQHGKFCVIYAIPEEVL